MALTADRTTPTRQLSDLVLPVAGGVNIFAGALVAINASGGDAGYATKGAAATVLRGVGVALEPADNTAGADGAITVKVRRGTWQFLNSASGDLITLADIGADCYIVDDNTVAKTNGSNTRSVAGKVRDVDARGVWVEFV